LLLSVGLLGAVAACGFDAQLLKPYTPADGTNLDVGQDAALKVRNLQVVSNTKGEGYLSATLFTEGADRLTGATVAPHTLEGTIAPAVPVTLPAPLELPAQSLTVLTDRPFITVRAPELLAGSSATVVMEFAEAGSVTLECPVVDGNVPPWNTISPSPSSTASPSPSASPTS